MRRQAQPQTGRVRRAIALCALAGAQFACRGQTETVSVTPSADAFVRSLESSNNYGAAGSLSVSGSGAVNGPGQQNGLFDSLLRFPMSSVAASFGAAFGSNGWVVTGATLTLTEVGAPNNAIFNRGVGAFELRWISCDTWGEGNGTPNSPTKDGVTYEGLEAVLNPALDVSLGQFTNRAVNGPESFPLALVGTVVSNIAAGSDLDLYLTAASPSVGFTFNSRNYGTSSAWPELQVTAVARPVAVINAIRRVETNRVTVHFNTASNWVYVVQGVSGLAPGGWSNLFTVPAKPLDDQAEFVDLVTNRLRCYRLMLSRLGTGR